jgi:mRNA degradation ribonuclease J1/J2
VVKLTQFPASNLQKEIQSVATSYIDEETKRRPLIFVTISKV